MASELSEKKMVLGVGGGRVQETGVGSRGHEADDSSVRTAEMLLRMLPMGLCLSALVIMLKNSQSNNYESISYANLGAFTFLVYANGVCACYSLLSAFYTAVSRPPTMSGTWTLFFLDQILTYAILAAGTVSTEILYLAYHGDNKVTWSEECGTFGSFCRRASASVGINFGAVACYVLLSLLSCYRLFSTFDAPATSKGLVEIAAFPG